MNNPYCTFESFGMELSDAFQAFRKGSNFGFMHDIIFIHI